MNPRFLIAIHVGALIGWGIPEDRLEEYENGLKDGGIVVGVKSKSDEDTIKFEVEWSQNRTSQINT